MQHQLLSVFLLSILVAIEAGYFDGLHVEGNQLKNQYGQTVRLRGVDRSGMEFMCIQVRIISDAAGFRLLHTRAIDPPCRGKLWITFGPKFYGYYC
jgi:hypothetical protein